MAETAIHENGISMKLCEICNSDTEFRKVFCKLFNNFPKENEIEYMCFTGNSETGFGKPDITIRLENGDFYFIEVKTKFYTEVQGNQELGIIDEKTKEKLGYIGLIEYLGQDVKNSYGFLVDQGHPNFEGKEKSIGTNDEYKVPIVTWNAVVDKINSYEKHEKEKKTKFSFFVQDLKTNVDGFDNKDDFFSLSKDDITFLSNPSIVYECANNFEKLRNLDVSCNYEIERPINDNNKGNIEFKFVVQKVDTSLPNFGWYIQVEKKLESNPKKHIIYPDWVWVGFNTYLLNQKDNNKKSDKYLFGISVYGDLLSHKKLKESDLDYYMDGDNWFYFPIDGDYSDIIKADNAKEIFEEKIWPKIETIFTEYIPSDTRRLNNKVLEK